MYDKVLNTLNNLGLAEKYKEKFVENDLDDATVSEWISMPILAESYLQSVIPSLGHRVKFIKEYNKTEPQVREPLNENNEDNTKENSDFGSLGKRYFHEVRVPASRQEVVSKATAEAIETYTLLMSVVEASLAARRLGNYLAECFFERYSRAAEKKALQVFSNRCDLADLGRLDADRDKLLQLIKFKKDMIIRPKLIQEANAEHELERRVLEIVNEYKQQIEVKLQELDNSLSSVEELEKIHDLMNKKIMEEFEKLEPRSTVFVEARQALLQKINEEFTAFRQQANVAWDSSSGQKYCMWLATIQPKQSLLDSHNKLITHAATEAIAAYTMLMNVMEESFEIFSEEFLDEDILEKFSQAAEEKALRLFIDQSGVTNPQVVGEMREIIKAKKEMLLYPNYLRKVEARATMEMEVEGTADNYKTEMEARLKQLDGKVITSLELERIHDAIHQSRLKDFSEAEPRTKIFKQVRSKLANKLEEESSEFKAALQLAKEKILRQGNELVDSVVTSYWDTMKNAPDKNEPAFEQHHQLAKSICMKTVENALKSQSQDVIKMFVDKVDSKIEGLRNN